MEVAVAYADVVKRHAGLAARVHGAVLASKSQYRDMAPETLVWLYSAGERRYSAPDDECLAAPSAERAVALFLHRCRVGLCCRVPSGHRYPAEPVPLPRWAVPEEIARVVRTVWEDANKPQQHALNTIEVMRASGLNVKPME